MLVKNEIYRQIIEDEFKIFKDGIDSNSTDITVNDLYLINDCNIIKTNKVDFLASSPPNGFAIFVHDKEKDTITPIVYGNVKQHKIYAKDIFKKRCDGDMSYHRRIAYKDIEILFLTEFQWFLSMKLIQGGEIK